MRKSLTLNTFLGGVFNYFDFFDATVKRSCIQYLSKAAGIEIFREVFSVGDKKEIPTAAHMLNLCIITCTMFNCMTYREICRFRRQPAHNQICFSRLT